MEIALRFTHGVSFYTLLQIIKYTKIKIQFKGGLRLCPVAGKEEITPVLPIGN